MGCFNYSLLIINYQLSLTFVPQKNTIWIFNFQKNS
jgi:hypothetical protein